MVTMLYDEHLAKQHRTKSMTDHNLKANFHFEVAVGGVEIDVENPNRLRLRNASKPRHLLVRSGNDPFVVMQHLEIEDINGDWHDLTLPIDR